MGESKAARFEELCGPYSAMVYRHCLQMLKNPSDAEDAAQETMLKAFKAFDRFHEHGTASWLYTIAHRTCLDILKSSAHQRETTGLNEEPLLNEIKDPGLTPEEAYLTQERRQQIWEAILKLPQKQQIALTLYYEEGLSYEEAAKASGMLTGTYKSCLSRAKAALAELLDHLQ